MSYRNPINDSRVAELTRAGQTVNQIAEELGYTPRSIVRSRQRLGIAGPPGRRFTPEEIERAEQMFADGCSAVEIDRTLGRSPGVTYKHFHGRGWTPEQVLDFAHFCSVMSRKKRQP